MHSNTTTTVSNGDALRQFVQKVNDIEYRQRISWHWDWNEIEDFMQLIEFALEEQGQSKSVPRWMLFVFFGTIPRILRNNCRRAFLQFLAKRDEIEFTEVVSRMVQFQDRCQYYIDWFVSGTKPHNPNEHWRLRVDYELNDSGDLY